MPRVQKLTAEVRAKFCAMVGVGFTRRCAAVIVGFNESSFRKAMQRHPDFAEEVRSAESSCIAVRVRESVVAANQAAQARSRRLERLNALRNEDPGLGFASVNEVDQFIGRIATDSIHRRRNRNDRPR